MKSDDIHLALKKLEDLLTSLSDSFDPNGSVNQASLVLKQIFTEYEITEQLLKRVQDHCTRQNKIRMLQRDIYECNSTILSMLYKLKHAEEQLENVIVQADHRRKAMEQSNQKKVDYDNILSYARRLAKYTSPPPPGMPINYPPIPQDAHMRRSLLFLPEVAEEASFQKEQNVQPQVLLEMDMSNLAPPPTTTHAAEEEDELLDLDL